MDCIKCDGKLERVEIENVTVDRCDKCFGIWFDSSELERILGLKSIEPLKSPEKYRRTDDEKRGHCPRCGGAGMLVRVASLETDIHIDTCSVCGGKWLDGGELEVLRGEGPLRSVRTFIRRLFS